MRRFSTRFKARVRIVDMWVDVGARSGESGEVARPHCPVRRVHGRPILGTATARERLYGSFLGGWTRARLAAPRAGFGAEHAPRATHPHRWASRARFGRSHSRPPPSIERARHASAPISFKFAPLAPCVRRFFFSAAPAIVAAVINPAPNLSLTFPLPPRPPSFRSSTARSSCLSRACWSSRRR